MMQVALLSAGFGGVEESGGTVYARSRPDLPEFTATRSPDGWVLAFAWPLRATSAQIAAWNALYPQVVMDLYLGETRIRTRATAENLAAWAGWIDLMVAKSTEWRRATRQQDEGM